MFALYAVIVTVMRFQWLNPTADFVQNDVNISIITIHLNYRLMGYNVMNIRDQITC